MTEWTADADEETEWIADEDCTCSYDDSEEMLNHAPLCYERRDKKRANMPIDMKPQYKPKTQLEKLGLLVEECGEVLAATGKSMRWGLDSVNPELPPEEQETNRDWLLRELVDLERAIGFARETLESTRKT